MTTELTTNSDHKHVWQPLGFRDAGTTMTMVIQACICGDAREVQARTIYEWNDEHPNRSNVELVAE